MNLKNLLLAISFLITLDSVSAQTCFNGYFKPNSTFDLNRRSLLSSIASNVRTHNGYYSTSIGQGSNRIFIIGMCIPVTKPDECSKCIQGGSDGLLGRCPNQTVGYVWPECCMVRYSNISFSESIVMEPSQAVSNPQAINVNLTLFDRIWGELMSRTITAATSTNVSSSLEHKYYAAEVASLNDIQTIYAMMECTPDVSSGSCKYCLKQTVVDYKKCCHGHKAGAFIRPFCFIRWGLIPFAGAFENVTSPPPPPELLPQPPPQFLPQLPLSLTPPRPKMQKKFPEGLL